GCRRGLPPGERQRRDAPLRPGGQKSVEQDDQIEGEREALRVAPGRQVDLMLDDLLVEIGVGEAVDRVRQQPRVTKPVAKGQGRRAFTQRPRRGRREPQPDAERLIGTHAPPDAGGVALEVGARLFQVRTGVDVGAITELHDQDSRRKATVLRSGCCMRTWEGSWVQVAITSPPGTRQFFLAGSVRVAYHPPHWGSSFPSITLLEEPVMLRSRFVLPALLLALLLGGAVIGDDKKADAPIVITRPQLPAGWKKLNVSEDQKKKTTEIQIKYRAQIAKLQEQIKKLTAEEKTELLTVLTDAQKAILKNEKPEPVKDKETPKDKEAAKDKPKDKDK